MRPSGDFFYFRERTWFSPFVLKHSAYSGNIGMRQECTWDTQTHIHTFIHLHNKPNTCLWEVGRKRRTSENPCEGEMKFCTNRHTSLGLSQGFFTDSTVRHCTTYPENNIVVKSKNLNWRWRFVPKKLEQYTKYYKPEGRAVNFKHTHTHLISPIFFLFDTEQQIRLQLKKQETHNCPFSSNNFSIHFTAINQIHI